ncbi:unnamed protein product [Lymnaea stagnalis]|uniref:ERCC4 domain-containing protein n=1 Tax=Lymnaea stagnalis TaxID=6523 RepID=A0AAV2H269_LYMST
MLTVFVDPAVAPIDKQKELITKACTEIGLLCEFVPQRVERTISWVPSLKTPASACEDIGNEVIAVLSSEDALQMINAYVQHKKGSAVDELTLTEWVHSVQATLPNQNLTVLIVGLEKYFRNKKLLAKQKHREAVTGQAAKQKKNTKSVLIISFQEAEEAFVELQLFTGCVVQHVETDEDLAYQIKLYTKAVRDKSTKKDRFDNVFSFLEEGVSGISVNKQGQGLIKVWKHQLMQFKNLSSEMAEAVLCSYPSPYLLHQMCNNNETGQNAEQLLADINVGVRRSASVISTNRKIGKEQARRIYTFMTAQDPNKVIK